MGSQRGKENYLKELQVVMGHLNSACRLVAPDQAFVLLWHLPPLECENSTPLYQCDTGNGRRLQRVGKILERA